MAVNKLILYFTCITLISISAALPSSAAQPSSAATADDDEDSGGVSFIETILEWVFGLGTEKNTKEVTKTANSQSKVAPTWGSILDAILQAVFGIGIKSGKRNMQEALTSYLDLIFKKDDVDTDLLKKLFMIYSEDDDTNFSSNYIGLGENMSNT